MRPSLTKALDRATGSRAVVFLTASLSFAVLLGHLWGLAPMHRSGWWVLPPAAALLACSAWRHRALGCRSADSPATWVITGAGVGIAAAAAYDLYRLPFVLGGAPLFKVFPRFGEMLLNTAEPRWAVHAVGWAYHFSNGAALGIMFLTLVAGPRRPPIVVSGVLWALAVEAALLLSPYAQFFGFAVNGRFLFYTISAHAVFGLCLGLLLRGRWSGPERTAPSSAA